MKLIDELRNRLTPKTPADRERVKKIAVYTVLCLSCLVCIWLIFAPSGDDEAVAGKANTELPDGTTDGIPDSKIAAYQQAAQNKEKETGRPSSKAYRQRLIRLPLSQQPICRTLSSHRLTHTSRLRLHYKTFISRSRQARHSRLPSCRNVSQNWKCNRRCRTTTTNLPMRWSCLSAPISLPPNIWAMATVAITSLHSRRRKKRQTQCPARCTGQPQCRFIARIIFQPWVQHLGRSTKDIKQEHHFRSGRQRPNYRQRSARQTEAY